MTQVGLLLLASITLAGTGAAQQAPPRGAGGPPTGWSGVIAAGPGIVPRFEGADDFRVVPLIVARAARGGYSVQWQGLGARADLLGSRTFEAGPVVNFRFGRGGGSGTDLIARLDRLDNALEVGGYLGYVRATRRGARVWETRADLLQGLNGHEGLTGQLRTAYTAQLGRWRVTGDATASWGNGRYMRAYYAVDAATAARTGLAVFSPGAGLKDLGVGANVGYTLDRRWGILGRASLARLVGDAADSPIVTAAGSRNQWIGGVALTYRF